MSSYGREMFRRLADDLWAAFRWVRDRDTISSGSGTLFDHVVDDLAIRELMSRLCYARSARDATWVSQLFADDAVVVGSPGARDAVEGAEEAGRVMVASPSGRGLFVTRYTNMLIRVAPAGEEAWITCYYDEPTSGDSAVLVRFGRVLGRLQRVAGAWQIADWRASIDFEHFYGDGSAIAGPTMALPEPPQSRFQARAWAPDRRPPFEGGRQTWHELRDDVWAAHHWLLDQPIPTLSSSDKLARVADEIAIREVLANYAYAHDSLDLAWSSSMFTDDAVLINENWVYSGNTEVVGAFRGWNRGREGSFHRFSNPIVRFTADGAEAWLIAYFHVAAARGQERNSGFGRYFGRLTKSGERWRISDWRIANDARLSLLPGFAKGGAK